MYKKIMVPLDGSKLAESVFPHLETVLKGCGIPQVVFVRAVEPIVIPYGKEAAKIHSMEELAAFETHNKLDAEQYLKDIVDRFKKTGVDARAEVIFGKASEVLNNYAMKNDIDLVIICSHGRSGISRLVLGSVAEHLLQSLSIPILMVRASGHEPSK